MSRKSFAVAMGAACVLVCCQLADAHPGHGLQSGFSAGVRHPFSGLDHILAMTAVGIYAARLGGKAIWLLPATFLALMIGGGALAMGGGYVPMVEQGIAASVLILGLLIAARSKPVLPVIVGMVGLFAIFHGFAHGAEMHTGLAPTSYALGFVLATSILLSIGVGIGLILKHNSLIALSRTAGVAVAVCGAILFWT